MVKCSEPGRGGRWEVGERAWSQAGLRLTDLGFPSKLEGKTVGGGLSRGAIFFDSRFNVKPLTAEEVDSRGSRVTCQRLSPSQYGSGTGQHPHHLGVCSKCSSPWPHASPTASDSERSTALEREVMASGLRRRQ